MFIFLFTCSDAVLSHGYTGDVISLSVKANRSAGCLQLQVPPKGLFYYIVRYFTSALYGCCTTDFVQKTVILRNQ